VTDNQDSKLGAQPNKHKPVLLIGVLGIRTADGVVTGIEYLSRGERSAAPADPT